MKSRTLGECNKSHQTIARGELRTSRSSHGSDVRLYTVALSPPCASFTRSDSQCSASRPHFKHTGDIYIKISKVIWSVELPPPNFPQFSRNHPSSLVQSGVHIVFQRFPVPCVSLQSLLLLPLSNSKHCNNSNLIARVNQKKIAP